MYQATCPRCVDKPITFFGLEIEDLGVIVILSGLIMFLVDPLFAACFSIISSVILRKIKEGKPQGYIIYLIYKTGLINFAPGFLRYPHLIKPPLFFAQKRLHFSCVEDPELDHKNSFERFYWFEKETIE